MADISIGINIPVSVDEVDMDKVTKLVKKFCKCADKLEANGLEMGAAISLMQDQYYETFGAIPISREIIAAIKESHMLDLKED